MGKQAIDNHKSVIYNHSPKRNSSPTKDSSKKQLAEFQILAQKASIKRNGYTHYEYVASKNSCPICKNLDGKVFSLSDLHPGINAPPMCENCHCSISAHTGESEVEYEAWLDFKSNGGTTAQ